jgi:hypothetical protein
MVTLLVVFTLRAKRLDLVLIHPDLGLVAR